MADAPRATLVLSPVFETLEEWLGAPEPRTADALVEAIADVATRLGLTLVAIDVEAPPLPELHGGAPGRRGGRKLALIGRGADDPPMGNVRLAGDATQAKSLAYALSLLFAFARARVRADRSAGQLSALEQAVRGIGGVLEVDRVLQLIADEVRGLVRAEYAAIGIVDADGVIERFLTSGISAEQRELIGELPRGRGLLGLIIREARPYRIRDITTHPQRYGFPPHHPVMHSFLGVPIYAGKEAVGRLYLTNKIGAPEFSADDQALVETFALHAGIAIENARLHDQVRRLAVVDERDRISRDLHDSVIQALYAQTLALDDVPDLIDEDPGEAARRVDEAIDALHAVIRDIRNFIFGLRPVLLEHGDLADGLHQLATELRRTGGIEVDTQIAVGSDGIGTLPLDVVAELLAVTREALSNIARHARAERASVRLDARDGRLRLEIADDGQGFDTARTRDGGHRGLANMRARVDGLGGQLRVDSGPSGTRIIVTLPRRGAASEENDRP